MRVVQIGAGRMSVYTMRYVIERGGELVAAYCRNPGHIGKDISEIMHWGEKRNVVVQDIRDMARTLKDAHADIAIITTRSILSELEEVFTMRRKRRQCRDYWRGCVFPVELQSRTDGKAGSDRKGAQLHVLRLRLSGRLMGQHDQSAVRNCGFHQNDPRQEQL